MYVYIYIYIHICTYIYIYIVCVPRSLSRPRVSCHQHARKNEEALVSFFDAKPWAALRSHFWLKASVAAPLPRQLQPPQTMRAAVVALLALLALGLGADAHALRTMKPAVQAAPAAAAPAAAAPAAKARDRRLKLVSFDKMLLAAIQSFI